MLQADLSAFEVSEEMVTRRVILCCCCRRQSALAPASIRQDSIATVTPLERPAVPLTRAPTLVDCFRCRRLVTRRAKLNELRRKNAITEAEYQAMRAKVLGL
jgi:hypothetical protein